MKQLSITPSIISEGYNRITCWTQGRAAALPDGGGVMTAQKLVLAGCDDYGCIHSRVSLGNLTEWSDFVPQAGLARRAGGPGIEIALCDGTPIWHAATGKVLATGHTAGYRVGQNCPESHLSLYRGAPVRGLIPCRTWYSVYDQAADTWAPSRQLLVPPELGVFGSGCTQRVDLADGTLLLPAYSLPTKDQAAATIVLRCAFDGETLSLIESGPPIRLPPELADGSARGFCEPSIARIGECFVLTLREYDKGYVATSLDGLHFSKPVPWTWHEDGTEIGSYNTQQHFATIGDRLYLVYTRRGVNNDHVFRHRAPLFIAEVSLDGFTPTLIRESEQIAVPERGARLGNFGVTNVSEREAWVVACEWMQSWRGGGEPGWSDCEAHGANNAIWLSRIELPAE
ncbi:MAG: exo-alpha-sialidase [Lentisphaerae bacterium]|nr:exo-alpha-sialidase [Lentisphaerota bacterium]